MTNQTNAEATTNSLKHKPKPTRENQLRKLLDCKSGASIPQIQKIFGWQPHTARATISGLRKAGTEIERPVSDKGSVYHVITADVQQ